MVVPVPGAVRLQELNVIAPRIHLKQLPHLEEEEVISDQHGLDAYPAMEVGCFGTVHRKVGIWLPGKGNSNSHGTRKVY